MNQTKKSFLYFLIVMISSSSALSAQLNFSGDVSAATTFVWRGIRQFHGAALQGTVCVSARRFTLGLFYSSMNSKDYYTETDPFVEIRCPLNLITGFTMYSYDFHSFNATAAIEIELSVKYSYKNFDCAGFYVPEQPSMHEYRSVMNYSNSSVYWIEGCYGCSALQLDWQLGAGFGTYSSRFVETAMDDPVGILTFSAAKSIAETISVNWNYAASLSSVMDNTFWVVIAMAF